MLFPIGCGSPHYMVQSTEGVLGIRPKVTSNSPFDLQADMGEIWVKFKGAPNKLSKVTKSFFNPSFQPSSLLIYHFSLHQ